MDFAWIIDTFFALFAFTLIILMVPGFAMLEAGLVRTKNVTAVLTVNTMIYIVASLVFFLWGYTLAFGGWDGSSMSKYAAFLFQMAFVGKTVNIMSGGVSERTRIVPLAIFTIFMAGLIYPLVVNWTWGANLLGGSFLDMPVNGFLKADVMRFHEQSIPVIELTNFLSDFNNVFFENGFKINVREAVRVTGFARPNFTNFAALHFLGSSCFNIKTLRNMTKFIVYR